jgi:hypothetical protein
MRSNLYEIKRSAMGKTTVTANGNYPPLILVTSLNSLY